MSYGGFFFFTDYITYLLRKNTTALCMNKYFHSRKVLEIKKLWNNIDTGLDIDDDDYYYAAILLFFLENNGLKLNYINMVDYTIGVVLISHKFNDDFAHYNIDWEQVIPYKISTINRIEVQILKSLEFDVYINDCDYKLYKKILERKMNSSNKIRKIIYNMSTE